MPDRETTNTQRQQFNPHPSIKKNIAKPVRNNSIKPMKYKGYPARIEYSNEDGCFMGRVIGIKDIITFSGRCVDELKESFEEAVEMYLDDCARFGRNPKRPYSGKFMLRLPTDLHASIANEADSSGKSLNQWVTDVLSKTIGK